MIVNKVSKKGYMNLDEIIHFQWMIYSYMSNISISEADIKCLTLLSKLKECDLKEFCNRCCDEEEREIDIDDENTVNAFGTVQSARNAIGKLTNLNLIHKSSRSKNKKKVYINPELNIITEGNIYVELKFLRKDDSR